MAQVSSKSPDPFLQYVMDQAARVPWIKRLILFGSRARGDSHERSDYDIAVETDLNQDWSKWALEVKEKAPTLCGIDLIELNKTTSEELKRVIAKEGQVIYEQQQR